MKLLTGGKDISQLIEKITWSGDTSQVSRKVNFTIAQNKKDTLFPNVSIDIGDEIIMQDNEGNNIFGGIIFDADKKGKKIKAAGGIKSFDDAEKFISLGANRLGTSRLIKIIKEG